MKGDKGSATTGVFAEERRWDDTSRRSSFSLIPSRFAIAMENERWILRNDMIWFKPTSRLVPKRTGCAFRMNTSFISSRSRRREGEVLLRSFQGGGIRAGRGPVQRAAGKERPFSHVPARAHQAADPEFLSSGRSRSRSVCGTGSAVECAAETGRRALGFELVEKFIPAE